MAARAGPAGTAAATIVSIAAGEVPGAAGAGDPRGPARSPRPGGDAAAIMAACWPGADAARQRARAIGAEAADPPGDQSRGGHGGRLRGPSGRRRGEWGRP